MKWILRAVLVLTLGGGMSLLAQEVPDPRSEQIIAAGEPTIIEQYDLANPNFSASVLAYPCATVEGEELNLERLELTNKESGETHVIAEQLGSCGSGLGAFGLSIRRWWMHDQYLYYTDAREGQPDGFALGWVPALYRVNLADLQVESLGQTSFSTFGNWLVAWDNTQVRLIEANSAETTSYTLLVPDVEIIDVTWIPDDSGIIFMQSDLLAGGSRTIVTHLDFETGAQNLLLDKAE